MFRNIIVTSFIIASACTMHLEYLKVDSEELLNGTLISATFDGFADQNEDLLMLEEQIFGACKTCKFIMKQVKRHLGNHENTKRIKEKLMTICHNFKPLENKCQNMVTKHIDMLVKELSTNDAPKTMCAKAGLCKRQPVSLN